MKVLVTGSNGFLGRHVVNRLLEDGAAVTAMVQPGTDSTCFAGLDINVVQGDLQDEESLLAATRGNQGVVHLAALVQDWGKREWFEAVNVQGTANLLSGARRAGATRFIFISSLAVHGFGDFEDCAEDTPFDDGGNPYAGSKIRCEEIVNNAGARSDLEAVVIRPGWVPYGQGDVRGFGALAQVIKRGVMPVAGNPDHHTCTVYGPNFAHGVSRALTSPAAPGRTYIIADREKTTWREYFQAIAQALDSRVKLLRLPCAPLLVTAACLERLWLRRGPSCRPPLTCYMLRLMKRNTHFTSHRAHTELGYEPRFTLDDGIHSTVDWWKHQLFVGGS